MKRAVLSLAAAIALSSCDAPGRRSAEEVPIRPAEVADFALLFSQNCSGCHGKDGQGLWQWESAHQCISPSPAMRRFAARLSRAGAGPRCPHSRRKPAAC